MERENLLRNWQILFHIFLLPGTDRTRQQKQEVFQTIQLENPLRLADLQLFLSENMPFESKKALVEESERLLVSLPGVFNPRIEDQKGMEARLGNRGLGALMAQMLGMAGKI